MEEKLREAPSLEAGGVEEYNKLYQNVKDMFMNLGTLVVTSGHASNEIGEVDKYTGASQDIKHMFELLGRSIVASGRASANDEKMIMEKLPDGRYYQLVLKDPTGKWDMDEIKRKSADFFSQSEQDLAITLTVAIPSDKDHDGVEVIFRPAVSMFDTVIKWERPSGKQAKKGTGLKPMSLPMSIVEMYKDTGQKAFEQAWDSLSFVQQNLQLIPGSK